MTATGGAADDSIPANSPNMLLRPIMLPRSQRITVATVCILCSILCQISPRDGWFFTLTLLIGFTSLFVVMRVPEQLGTSRRRRRPWVPLLILFAFLVNVGYETCPHARYVSFGPAVIPIGGKPCNNQRHPHTLVTRLAGVRSPWWN